MPSRAAVSLVVAALLGSSAGLALPGPDLHVPAPSQELAARLSQADAYASRGLIEEAVAEYVAILAREPGQARAREGLWRAMSQAMPKWLPGEVEQVRPFAFEVLGIRFLQSETEGRYRFLVTLEGFAVPERSRADPLHHWEFPRAEYGYVWERDADGADRWVLKCEVHWEGEEDQLLARDALRGVCALWAAARHHLGRDPTRPWGQPVQVWVTRRGEPGARALGRDIYLYATGAPRAPGEWWRELAHEYGHVALPGIGGFAQTEDPWADGELGELLFPKWLTGALCDGRAEGRTSSPTPQAGCWLPWSLSEAEGQASSRREQLIRNAAGPVDVRRLSGTDSEARDYFLGLALRVEEERGPRALAAALSRCPRGSALDFARASGLWRASGKEAPE